MRFPYKCGEEDSASLRKLFMVYLGMKVKKSRSQEMNVNYLNIEQNVVLFNRQPRLR